MIFLNDFRVDPQEYVSGWRILEYSSHQTYEEDDVEDLLSQMYSKELLITTHSKI